MHGRWTLQDYLDMHDTQKSWFDSMNMNPNIHGAEDWHAIQKESAVPYRASWKQMTKSMPIKTREEVRQKNMARFMNGQ